jgi:hypothetical protein
MLDENELTFMTSSLSSDGAEPHHLFSMDANEAAAAVKSLQKGSKRISQSVDESGFRSRVYSGLTDSLHRFSAA